MIMNVLERCEDTTDTQVMAGQCIRLLSPVACGALAGLRYAPRQERELHRPD